MKKIIYTVSLLACIQHALFASDDGYNNKIFDVTSEKAIEYYFGQKKAHPKFGGEAKFNNFDPIVNDIEASEAEKFYIDSGVKNPLDDNIDSLMPDVARILDALLKKPLAYLRLILRGNNSNYVKSPKLKTQLEQLIKKPTLTHLEIRFFDRNDEKHRVPQENMIDVMKLLADNTTLKTFIIPVGREANEDFMGAVEEILKKNETLISFKTMVSSLGYYYSNNGDKWLLKNRKKEIDRLNDQVLALKQKLDECYALNKDKKPIDYFSDASDADIVVSNAMKSDNPTEKIKTVLQEAMIFIDELKKVHPFHATNIKNEILVIGDGLKLDQKDISTVSEDIDNDKIAENVTQFKAQLIGGMSDQDLNLKIIDYIKENIAREPWAQQNFENKYVQKMYKAFDQSKKSLTQMKPPVTFTLPVWKD